MSYIKITSPGIDFLVSRKLLQKLEEDVKLSMSGLPFYEEVSTTSRAGKCFGIQFGFFRMLHCWLEMRYQRYHNCLLSNNEVDIRNRFLKGLRRRTIASPDNGSCVEVKIIDIHVPVRDVVVHQFWGYTKVNEPGRQVHVATAVFKMRVCP